jgi:predicted metalloprotease with PDZ domain
MTRLHHRIQPHNPRAHVFRVSLTIDEPDANQAIWMPVWIPGSYMIREFARHVMSVVAKDDRDNVIVAEKANKHTWMLQTSGSEKSVTIVADIYARDLSVRAAHLDTSHGFFNGPSVFFAVEGRLHEPCTLIIDAPTDPACVAWKVATTLTPSRVDASGFGSYTAPSYDELIDHPVEMGTFQSVRFTACDGHHGVTSWPRARCRSSGYRFVNHLYRTNSDFSW